MEPPRLQRILYDEQRNKVKANPLPSLGLIDFFKGELYANPLHNLADVLQERMQQPSVADNLAKASLLFTEQAIVVENVAGEQYPYAQITDLKIHHQRNEASRYGQLYGELKFTFKKQRYNWDVKANHRQSIKLCQLLLEQRIPFKEYFLGTRSHLANIQINYQQIQGIKREYGIVW